MKYNIFYIILSLSLIFTAGCDELTELEEIVLDVNQVIEQQNRNQQPIVSSGDTLSIISWNLQIFGDSKVSKPAVYEYIKDTLQLYDVSVIQEIRDKDGSSFDMLCNDLALYGYECVVSSRLGSTSSKEQYGLVYKNDVTVNEYRAVSGDFERNPYVFTLTWKNSTFDLITIHTKPDETEKEMDELHRLFAHRTDDTIILGDLNADCRYYRSFDDFVEWNWLISDYSDTTTSQTDCAYDRIITTKDVIADDFIQEVDADVSDHHIVGMVLQTI